MNKQAQLEKILEAAELLREVAMANDEEDFYYDVMAEREELLNMADLLQEEMDAEEEAV